MIADHLSRQILILDGAMGTMIQKYHLSEADYRGLPYAQHSCPLKGCNDLLSITRPDIIAAIHEEYLRAGADIIETNTFNSTSISLSDYQLPDQEIIAINRASVRLARQAADTYTLLTPEKPRYVAGAVGPTNKTCSMSPDVSDPALRNITYQEMRAAYSTQMEILIEEGVDAILIETIFDTLNAKAAIDAAMQAMTQQGREVPLMLSVTLSDKGGRTLSGQTVEAFLASVSHAPLLSVGLNCSFGARDMKPHLAHLSQLSPYYISAYPNAGLPNSLGEYDETPDAMAEQIKEYIDERLVNIIGGCCGTTPEHIAQYASLIPANYTVRQPSKVAQDALYLSGLECLVVNRENNFVPIGERCNVAGSRLFLRLIKEKKYDQALAIALRQIEEGALIIDINLDDALLETDYEMTHLLRLISSDPDIARVPIMIDSSRWEVIENALGCLQGKSIVNSISLKEGESVFIERAMHIRRLGAAVVVMAFDERGQADTCERKTAICQRAYQLLVAAGFPPQDIIFDPNVLSIATGIEEHNNYGVDFIEATRWIKQHLPHARVSGGVSNLSFALRGNNYIREVMHSIFLYHAIQAGLDMAIINPSTTIAYADIPQPLRTLVENVILNRLPDGTEQLIEVAQNYKDKPTETTPVAPTDQTPLDYREAIEKALIKGDNGAIDRYIPEALEELKSSIAVIDGPLMEGMNAVGQLFGEGKMFLPQVVKSARTMKYAVTILQPYIEEEKRNNVSSAVRPKCLLATVKGDVHDIGKNIVALILSCNNFEVIDMGVMIPSEEIIKRAIADKVDLIGVSGLITPSLEEMSHLAEEMQRQGLEIPLFIGGATTSEIHTAVKIAPLYNAPVIHLRDAAKVPGVATLVLNKESGARYAQTLSQQQHSLREAFLRKSNEVPPHYALTHRCLLNWNSYTPTPPKQLDTPQQITLRIDEVRSLINYRYLYHAWQVPPESNEANSLRQKAEEMLDQWSRREYTTQALYTTLAAHGTSDAIVVTHRGEAIELPTPRQSEKQKNDTYLALCDYVMPATHGSDYIAFFATTVSKEIEELIQTLPLEEKLLAQTVADRLAEATTEWLHYHVRTCGWGYTPQEPFDAQRLMKQHYQGIRPAIGYPSLPEQSIIFTLNRIMPLSKIGITITESGAMSPSSSTCGLMIGHPEAGYFIR